MTTRQTTVQKTDLLTSKGKRLSPGDSFLAFAYISPIWYIVSMSAGLSASHFLPRQAFEATFWIGYVCAAALTIGVSFWIAARLHAVRSIVIVVSLVTVAALAWPTLYVHSIVSACSSGPAYPLDRHPCESDGMD